MATERDGGLFWLSYDVVNDSLAAICLARLCPQFRCQPKVGVLADDSFHREASSLIDRPTFGRCTVALGYNGCNRLHVGLHLIDAMLDHFFFLRTCKDGIVQEDCLLRCGKHVEVSTTPASPVFFRKHTFTRRVSWALTSAWSAPYCRASSVNVTASSKSWYMLYPLGLPAFALQSQDKARQYNSGESQTGGS